MTIEALLSRLDKVKSRGSGRWMASCPCHEDRTPSLAIRDDNGTILLHCFSQQCAPAEICNSLGIKITELFPPNDNYDASKHKQKRMFFDAQNVLEGLAFESLVLLTISSDMKNNKSISDEEHERLGLAVARVHASLEYTRRITHSFYKE